MPGPGSDDTAEESVRRLLADARHTEPLPPEVAARLDGLLGELVAARSAGAGVASLAARRSRRRGLLLVAAAAAVVVGVAAPTLSRLGSLDRGGSDSSTSSTADSTGGNDSTAESSSGLAQAPTSPGGAPADAQPPAGVVLTSADFETVVRRTSPSSQPGLPLPPGCAGVEPGAGDVLAATYDGAPALLVFRPPAGGTRVVDLLACGTATVIRTTTVPAS